MRTIPFNLYTHLLGIAGQVVHTREHVESDDRVATRRSAVVELLSSGERSAQEILTRLNLDRATVYIDLRELEAEGMITRRTVQPYNVQLWKLTK